MTKKYIGFYFPMFRSACVYIIALHPPHQQVLLFNCSTCEIGMDLRTDVAKYDNCPKI